MSLYEPPRVRVADTADAKPGAVAIAGAVGIPWLLCLASMYFVTPAIAEGIASSAAGVVAQDNASPSVALMLAIDLILDALFVAVATWWAIALSRLAPFPLAALFALALLAVRALELGGLPGVINTGMPIWYDLGGNANDLLGALLAAALHQIHRAPARGA